MTGQSPQHSDVLRSIIGKNLGVTEGGHLVGDLLNGIAFGDQLYHSAYGVGKDVVLLDDFFGTTLRPEWITKKGSDGSAAYPVPGASKNGAITGASGAGSTHTMAVNGTQISGGLDWYMTEGKLFFETKIQLSTLSTISLFVGFTNQVSALGIPANSAASGNTVTSNVNDYAGILFDSSMTTQDYFAVSSIGGTPATPVDTKVAPTGAATYDVLRVELDVNGNASYFINGTLVGTTAGAITKTVAVAPVIAMFSRATAQETFLADYIYVHKNRS